MSTREIYLIPSGRELAIRRGDSEIAVTPTEGFILASALVHMLCIMRPELEAATLEEFANAGQALREIRKAPMTEGLQ